MNYLRNGLTALLSPLFLFAQTKQKTTEAFDSIFYHTYMETATTDLDKALHTADSLYQSSKTDIHKIRSLMLISDMYHRKANRDSSIYYAKVAEDIAHNANIFDWQARISGVLSTQYRNMGLYKQGSLYLKKGLEASENIQDPNTSKQFRGQVYQEKGYYALNLMQYDQAVNHFKTARALFESLPESKNRILFLSQTEEQLGKSFLKLRQLDSARLHYKKGLQMSTRTSDGKTVFKGFIHLGLAKVNLAQNKMEQAKDHLDKALDISETAGLPDFKADVYQCLATYSKATGDIDQYTHFNDLYVAVVKNTAVSNQQYSDNVVTKVKQELEQTVASNKMFLSGAIIALVLVSGISILYVKRQRQDQKRYRSLIANLKKKSEPTRSATLDTSIGLGNTVQERLMPIDTELHILDQLDTFEKGQLYLQPNLTLAQLAVQLEVNTKYLSHTINRHKGKDFNNYINELRIVHIVGVIEKNPKYLSYKIGYIASECGFSSHSKFATVFKNVTGLTPSSFIDQVKKERKNLKRV
ncbi:MAG TPA: hypothetical protein DEF18_01395 [Muricauda sp.]|nr:response regulator transcription factor [uncultured Allomuricauda sp.]MAO18090.1 hypothetical protein [Allomuricauda sp.]MBC72491.1 hypothetical protein [Allomuricauda sp.]HBU76734.1 hypothetical protein [Allomuricauda sp.]|tara:strand:+ start:275 stop:1855 length:1581 start_codon:yes stop_codon:yes gene_type:complete